MTWKFYAEELLLFSAKDMDLDSLKKKYGKYICFNGGFDGQRLILNGSPDEIKEEVDRIKKLFDYNGV